MRPCHCVSAIPRFIVSSQTRGKRFESRRDAATAIAALSAWNEPTSGEKYSREPAASDKVKRVPSSEYARSVILYSLRKMCGSAPQRAAASRNCPSSRSSPKKSAGVPLRMTANFSAAIFSSVSPRKSVWSMPIGTTTLSATSVRMFDASSRPPIPASNTAASGCLRASIIIAAAVINSKYVGWLSLK